MSWSLRSFVLSSQRAAVSPSLLCGSDFVLQCFKKQKRELKSLNGNWRAASNVAVVEALIEPSSRGQHHPPFPGLIRCHYDARLRPKEDICPDQDAVVILGVQITDPCPSLLDDGLLEK